MFEFHNPSAFLLLLLIPLLFLLRKLKIFSQITYPAVLADWNGKVFEWKGKLRQFFSVLARVLLVAAFILTIFAIADPVKVTQEKIYTTLGTDIIFVVDTSPSMAAKDVEGQYRINVAKNAISKIIREHDGFRYGVVTLGSEASVFVPPTANLDVFEKRLSDIEVGILGNGSAIGDGLSTAVCHLSTSSAPKKCIILLTDGENNAGAIHPETAAKLAAEKEIPVYIVGIGSKGTVPIEYKDPKTGKLYSGYLDSNFNSASLRQISHISNGKYFEVKTVDELSQALNYVTKTENIIQNYTYKTMETQYYKYLVLIAIFTAIFVWVLRRVFLKERVNFFYKKVIIFRTIFLGIAFIMLVLGYFGFTWGSYLAPVQKNGTSVSFVMDISNSMMAHDGPNQMTRLEASSIYAKKLLEKMDGTCVSVVLAKGDGIAAIPLTEDKIMIESLLDVLSPNLMTEPGTSLSKGILCAKDTFPDNFSSAGRIWVFTDGEETDGQLSQAFTECIKSGIPVTMIGFGAEKEVNVLAGDKKTYVKTALRSQSIMDAIESAGAKLKFFKIQTPVTYINSSEKGSAVKLLNQLSTISAGNQIVSYEAKPIPHFKMFLILSVLFFAFSYIFAEFDFRIVFAKWKKNKIIKTASALCIFTMFFTGCSNQVSQTLEGVYSFHQKQYRHSIANFKKSSQLAENEENQIQLDYSLYNLGTAYLSIGEDESAMKKFSQISSDADKNVKYGAFYNAGIIAYKNSQYEDAKKYFRKALEADNSKIDAKINLELSLQMLSGNGKQNETKTIPASDDKTNIPDIEKGVFERIKENDQKQWKNSESNQSPNLAEDY